MMKFYKRVLKKEDKNMRIKINYIFIKIIYFASCKTNYVICLYKLELKSEINLCNSYSD